MFRFLLLIDLLEFSFTERLLGVLKGLSSSEEESLSCPRSLLCLRIFLASALDLGLDVG